MPKTVREVLLALAAKAKVDVNSEVFKDAMSTPDFDRVLIPDEVFAGIDNGLLNLDTAKDNYPAIRAHYTAQAYDTIDKIALETAQEEKFDEATISELRKITSTPEKIKFLNKKLKEHESKKASVGKVDKEAWSQEKAEMQELLRLAKEEAPKVRAEMEGRLREKDMMYAKRQALSKIKTIDEDLDPEVRQAMHEAIINTGLRKIKAKLDVDQNGELLLMDETGGIVYDEGHRPVTPNSFFEKVFAENKRLKVTEPVNQQAANQQYRAPQGANGHSQASNEFVQGNKAANPVVLSKNAQALADYNAANAAGSY